jgi:hypothetical protein
MVFPPRAERDLAGESAEKNSKILGDFLSLFSLRLGAEIFYCLFNR